MQAWKGTWQHRNGTCQTLLTSSRLRQTRWAGCCKVGQSLGSASSLAVVCLPTATQTNVPWLQKGASTFTMPGLSAVPLLHRLHAHPSSSSLVCAWCITDLQLVFADFELDLEAALPQHWQQLTQGSASDASSVSPHSIKLRSRLLSLLSARKGRGGGGDNSGSSRGGGASAGSDSCQASPRQQGRAQSANSSGGGGVDPVLPSSWAGKLQAVVEVLELAGQERGHALGEWEAAQQRVQLLETNVQEVGPLTSHQTGGRQLAAVLLFAAQFEVAQTTFMCRQYWLLLPPFAAFCQLQKLVSTQESLQQQLATQVDTNSAKAQSQQQEMQQMAADLMQAQAQLQEAQAAVAATTEELQVSGRVRGCVAPAAAEATVEWQSSDYALMTRQWELTRLTCA